MPSCRLVRAESCASLVMTVPKKHAGFEIAEKEALCQLGVVIDFHSCRLFVVVIFDTADDGRNVHVGHTLTARPRKDQFAIILRVHEEIFG